MSIPIINIEALFGTDLEAKKLVGHQIDEACRKSGFFQISKHGIDLDILNKLTPETFRFFEKLSHEQKMRLARKRFNPTNSNKYRGYFPASANGKEGLDIGNPDETLDIFKKNLPLHELSVWPNDNELPGFKNFFLNYYLMMSKLAQVILRGFAIGSGKEETFFDEKVSHENCMSTLRLNYYPFLENIDAVEIASDGTRLGCETHRDSSLITILFQPIEGLQVEDEKHGWIDVKPSNEYFVINTGRAMSRYTNNTYNAANHRVKFINQTRVSVPFFVEPGFNCVIQSYTPNNQNEKSVYEDIAYGDWLLDRLQHLPEYNEFNSTKTY